MRSHLPFVVALLGASVAAAEEPASPHAYEIGWSQAFFSSFFRATPSASTLDLGWQFSGLRARTKLPLELSAGLRAAPPSDAVSVPLDLHVGASLVGELGPWSPMIGPRLGISGFATIPPRPDGLPEDIDRVEADRVSPLYVAFEASPLRFRWRTFTISALDLEWGATLFPAGTALRLRLGWIKLGVTP